MKTYFYFPLLLIFCIISCNFETKKELDPVELTTNWDKNQEVISYILSVRELQSFVISISSKYDLKELGELGRKLLTAGESPKEEKSLVALKYVSLQKAQYDKRLKLRRTNPEIDDNQTYFTQYLASKMLNASEVLESKNLKN